MKTEERQVDDASLVERALNGDRAAFDQLMQRHVEMSFRIARRFGLSSEDAADVIQDSFLAAYRSLQSFNFSFSFSTWITRILLNRLSNFRRGMFRAKRIFWRPEDTLYEGIDFEEKSAVDPQVAAENAEFRAAFEKALKKLPQKQRTVFVLFEIEGFKTREIASILDIPEGTVTSRLHHARLSLRKYLKNTFSR
jgi:RNA polymerase sigma-70 factor (ECF subfamily)